MRLCLPSLIGSYARSLLWGRPFVRRWPSSRRLLLSLRDFRASSLLSSSFRVYGFGVPLECPPCDLVLRCIGLEWFPCCRLAFGMKVPLGLVMSLVCVSVLSSYLAHSLSSIISSSCIFPFFISLTLSVSPSRPPLQLVQDPETDKA